MCVCVCVCVCVFRHSSFCKETIVCRGNPFPAHLQTHVFHSTALCSSDNSTVGEKKEEEGLRKAYKLGGKKGAMPQLSISTASNVTNDSNGAEQKHPKNADLYFRSSH